jgi:hypothetical protein
MTKRAGTPAEKAIAESFNRRFTRHEEWKAKNSGNAPGNAVVEAEKAPVAEEPDDSVQPVAPEKPPSSEAAQQGGSEEGIVREAQCAAPAATVKFAILGETLLLFAPDTAKIEYRTNGKESTLAANPCSGWNHRKARITFVPTQDKRFKGQIVSVEFQ